MSTNKEDKFEIHLDRSLFMGVDSLEEKLGLTKGFFENLQTEDDWSFIIKLHTLFESVCTHLLVFHFEEKDLSEIFSKLELSNKSYGKLVFLKNLNLISADDRRFISSLSELRNQLVHNVTNSDFNLEEMVSNFNSVELKKFTKTFSPFESRTVDLKKGFIEVNKKRMAELMDRALKKPKLHLWVGAHNLLVSLGDNFGYSDFKKYIKAKNFLDLSEDE